MSVSAEFLPEFGLEMAPARRTLERIQEDKLRPSTAQDDSSFPVTSISDPRSYSGCGLRRTRCLRFRRLTW